MPNVRNSLICLGALSVGAAVSLVLFQRSSPISLPSPARPPEVQERLTSPEALALSFPSPQRRSTERRLEIGHVHLYPLPTRNGDLLELIVEQDGVDLQVSIFGPDTFFIVDSPNATKGPERILLFSPKEAVFQAKVSSRSPGGVGRYRIWIAAQRPATEQDVKEAAAEKMFHQAKEAKAGAFGSGEFGLREASRLWQQTQNISRQADALRLLGDLYKEQQDYQRSLQVFRQAKSLYHQANRLGDEGVLANSIGTLYVDISALDLAEESYVEAQILGRRAGNEQVTTTALYGLGIVAWIQGRSADALGHLERARSGWKKLNDKQEAKALTALGGVFADAGETDLAVSRLKESLAISEKRKDLKQKAITLTQMGNVYVKRESGEQAEDFYRKAMAIQQSIRDEANLPVTLNGLGLTLLNQRQPEEALDPFLKSLQLVRRTSRPREQARILTNLGWTYSALRREGEARLAYEEALLLARKTKDRWMETAALLGLAKLEEARGNPIEAQKQAQAAVQTIEDLRTDTKPGLRIKLMASWQDSYNALAEMLLWQHELLPSAGFDSQALKVVEQARSRGLLDKIVERSQIKGREERSPASRILSPEEIRRLVLGPDTLLLEYYLGERASYLWLIDPSFGIQVFRLPPKHKLEPLIEKTRQLLVASRRREKGREARQAMEVLSRTLIGPVAPWLGNKRLLISVPDALQAIPFGVLTDPSVPAMRVTGWPRPLIVDHEIVKIPSASVLLALRVRESARTPPPGLLALLADPVFGPQDERLASFRVAGPGEPADTALDSLMGPFSRLTYARKEADAILREVGNREMFSAFGFEATRDLVLSGRLRGFRNVHLATHGLLRSDDADLSALVFSLLDFRGRRRNGFLRASEISRLELPADLVTLSACETGLGERIPGEGLVGLPHAFFAAGASRVLVSLWPVNDLATAKLMERFYQEYLGQGLSPAAALREAQKAMWQDSDRNAPFYWGGFELQGDWRAVSSPH